MRGSTAPPPPTCRGCAPGRAAPCARTTARSAPAPGSALVPLSPAARLLPTLQLARSVVPVAPVRPCGGELTQLVPDHRLRDEHRHVLAPVVHGDRVADELRED